MRELTGFADHQGTPIREGVIIEFWIDPDRGYSLSAAPGYAHMTDTVKFVDHQWYFWDETSMRADWRRRTHTPVRSSETSMTR